MSGAGTMGDERPRAILFDWDNTLVTNWRCIHAATNAALAAFGKPAVSLEESYSQVRRSLRDSFPEIFGEEWRSALKIFYDHFEAHHLDYLEPLPGAEALLEGCAAQDIYLGVVSNKTGRFLRREAEHLGWSHFFGTLVGATDAPRDKPAIDPVRMALAPSGLDLGPSVWFVGDADIDMECAHKAGCTPVLVGNTPMVHEGLDRYPPRHRLHDCHALYGLVRACFDTIS